MRDEKRAAWAAFAETFEHGRNALSGGSPEGRGGTNCVFCARVGHFVRATEPDAIYRWRWWDPRTDGPEDELPAERRADVTPTVETWDEHVAFRPLTPVTPLHTLVIPKAHVDDHTHGLALAATMFRAAELARGFEHAGYDTNLVVSAGKAATQSVRHLHVHVIPRTADDGLMVPWGTVYGDDPTAPHWCRTAQQLKDQLDTQALPDKAIHRAIKYGDEPPPGRADGLVN